VLLVIVMSACYAPGIEPSCTIACVADQCPSGYVCTDGKVCAMPGDTCGAPPANDGSQCYGNGTAPFLRVCPTFSFPPTLTINGVLDTDACMHPMSQQVPGAPELCVLAADDITVVGGVKVRGARPLLLLGARSVVIEPGAVLDVASHVDSMAIVPGSPGPGCTATRGASDVSATTAGGGGGGGSFRGPGGVGGSGGLAATVGGEAGTLAVATFLRGGCPGADGGFGGALAGGVGGGGGGAVYLMSNRVIRIEGIINASGGGASPAKSRGGGGGGGSGGMILLDGAEVTFAPNGGAFALGGGGSSGGNETIQGSSGTDPVGVGAYAGASQPALTSAGIGGGGGNPLIGTAGTEGGTSSGGGGGGGGGGGVIRIMPAGPYPRTDPPAQ